MFINTKKFALLPMSMVYSWRISVSAFHQRIELGRIKSIFATQLQRLRQGGI